MNKIIMCLVGLTLLTFQNVSAQGNFKDGFIITNENDTIYGQIAVKGSEKSYLSCLFLNGEGEQKEYSPLNIKGYSFIDGKSYTSQIIPNFFLERLVKGEASLYRYRNEFYLQKDGETHELKSQKIEALIGTRTTNRDDGKWKGILAYLFNDCEQAVKQINKGVRLHEKPLTKLVVTYNQCQNSSYVEVKSGKKWSRLEYGLMVGFSNNRIVSRNNIRFYSYLADEYVSNDPMVGLVANLRSPRLSERLSFQVEVQYSQSSYEELVVLEGPVTEYNRTTIDLSTISVPISVKFKFSQKKVDWFLQAGLSIDKQLSPETFLYRETVLPGNIVEVSPLFRAYIVGDVQTGLWSGAGITKSHGKFSSSLSVRYFFMSKLNPFGFFLANRHNLQVNYTLMKL
ncbi:MAG: outer membrane beta-barrel protein [Bacteroidota bacterium]